MALEMKGLKGNMVSLAKRVERLSAKAAAADAKGGELESHLDDIEGQFGQHISDIEFTAQVLGNSGGLSEQLGSADILPKPEPFREPGVGDDADKQ